MNKSLGIVLLALLGPASAGAQVEDPLLESWRWAYFSAEDGVPSNSIICVLEAADGTVWVASETGFAWFDGYRWRPVNLPVPIRRITAVSLHPGDGVLAAIDGRLWHVRESGTEEVMVDFGTTARGILQAIMLDDGTMLVIAADTSLYHIDANLRRRRVELSARMLLQLRDGSTWLSTPSHLFRFESGEWTSVSLVQPATFLGVDSHGVLTAASTTGPTQTLVTWSSAGNVVTAAVPRDNDVVAFDVAPDGTALAMFESREVYVRLDGRWDYLTDVPEPLLDATFIRFSHSGDLWVGTRDGLYLNHRSQARWTNRTDLMRAPGDRVVSALHVAGNGDVWLGTGSRLIVERADGRIERFDRVRGLAMNGVSGIGEDGDGGIWISNPAAGGIVRFYEGRWRRFDDTDGIATQRIHRIAQSSDGRVWLLGISDLPHTEEGPGAFSFDGRGFTTWDRADGLPSENIYSFGETLDGSIWFGTDSLLARLHGDEWTYYTKSDGLRSNRVATMIGGPDGSLWLGHMHGGFGLGRIFPDGSIRYYDVADGLGNDDVRDLDFGSDGSLWIATRNGVSRFRDGYISQHSAVAGLKHASFLQVAVSRNRILLGSSAGGLYELPVSRMNEPAPVVNIAPPLVGPRQTVLRWKPYSYYGLPPAATIRTRFRMDGLDWSHWSTQHEVAVLAPSPGTHSLEVEAMGLLGSVANQPSQIAFRIPPPLLRHPVVLTVLFIWLFSLGGIAVAYIRRQKRFAAATAKREAYYRSLLERGSDIVMVVDREGTIEFLSPSSEPVLGIAPADWIGSHVANMVHHDDHEHIKNVVRAIFEGRDEPSSGTKARVRRRDGSWRTFTLTGSAHSDIDEKELGVIHARDITEEELANQEQARLGEQLKQAQKMEAMGQLTGGVAHDFNNLLTIILGNLDLVREEGGQPESLAVLTEQALSAAQRASALTQQLLAFSRKQALKPELTDLGNLVLGMTDMLRRTLGETVAIENVGSGGLWACEVDRHQMENVVLNLAINARDAMPGGGTLTLRTDNVTLSEEIAPKYDDLTAGEYVRLTVSDTGVGMPPEVVDQVFDPFFTTKEVGKGSGLGLSMVYGFVRQSGGQVHIYSETDTGTTIKMYLPKSADSATPASAADEPEVAMIGSGETVLVVEDDPAVRKLADKMLMRLGYETVVAEDGPSALEVLRATPDVSLLFTDIVLPGGMSGADLAREAVTLRPELKVLYTSGYAQEVIAHQGRIDANVELIEKPYTKKALAEYVTAVMH